MSDENDVVVEKLKEILTDELYEGSKDWKCGDLVERVEWLISMYEGVKRSEELAWNQLAIRKLPKFMIDGKEMTVSDMILEIGRLRDKVYTRIGE